MRLPLPLLVAGVAVISFVACGGGSDSDSDAQVIASPSFTVEDAEASARGALLSLDDMPKGWTAEPATEEVDEQSDLDLPPQCEVFEDEVEEFKGVAEVESDEFAGPEEELIQSDVTVYANDELAQQAIDKVRQLVEDCSDPLRDAFKTLFEEQLAKESEEDLSGLTVSGFSFEIIDFPELGDETLATRMTFGVQVAGLIDLDFALDLIGIRTGKVIGGLIYQSFSREPDSDLEDQLARVIEQRAASADASLE